MIRTFALGVCAGAALTWWLKEAVPAQVDARTGAVRAKVARRLRAAADAIEEGLSAKQAAPPVRSTPPC